MQLPVASLALGVIDGGHEVGIRCGLDAALDTLPRGHQVGEGDDTEIVSDGCAQQGGCLLECTDTG